MKILLPALAMVLVAVLLLNKNTRILVIIIAAIAACWGMYYLAMFKYPSGG